jgi:hypothetical protein
MLAVYQPPAARAVSAVRDLRVTSAWFIMGVAAGSGEPVHASVQRIGLPSARLWRTVASFSALVKSREWQVMQVVVGRIPAKADFSTDVWQQRQSRPTSPT